ncbi:MAG: hypothetical protein LBT51_03675 [Fusobacteriaceae bacterium]|nr:hypothetical protein [Fusobacteriaceae bacterium]
MGKGFDAKKNMENLQKLLSERNFNGNQLVVKGATTGYVDISDIVDTQDLQSLREEVGEELLNTLIQKSIEFDNICCDMMLDSGKILEDVFTAISQQGSIDGVYTKWLEIKGISPKSAWRHRLRYKLYTSTNNEAGKKCIKQLPTRQLDCIKKIGEDELLKQLNDPSITKEKLKEFINANIAIITDQTKINNTEETNDVQVIEKEVTFEIIPKNVKIYETNDILSIVEEYEKKKEKLSEEEKTAVSRHLSEISRILEKE